MHLNLNPILMNCGVNFIMNQAEYIRRMKRHKKFILFYRLLILILFFSLWELAARFQWIDAFIFSSPSRMFHTFISLLPGGIIWKHIGITLLETFISFILVMFLGACIAMILWWNTSISAVLEPYLVALNSLPKTALAPVLIVWLGNNMKTIIVCALLLAVFGTIINLYAAFKTTDPDKLLLITTLDGGKKDQLTKVVIPANIPSFIGSLKVNIGLCLVGVIIGEFLAANAGLGYLIIYSSQVFKLDTVMMAIIILCLVATGLYGGLAFLEKKMIQ